MSSIMIDIKYSQRIRELMREEKVNQVILSQKIGVVQSTISAWLNGKKEPSIKSLWLLAEFFQVSIDYIVGRVDF